MTLTETIDPKSDVAIDIAVRCRGITKTYGAGTSKVTALRGIDLDVTTDELLMLVGPSGCGKTTLISVIAGILDQNEGECIVFGNDFKHMSQSQKTRKRGELIGFVFQAFNLLPTLTATENVAIPLLLNGVRRPEAMDRAYDMLKRVGLAERTEIDAEPDVGRTAAARRDRPGAGASAAIDRL